MDKMPRSTIETDSACYPPKALHDKIMGVLDGAEAPRGTDSSGNTLYFTVRIEGRCIDSRLNRS